MHPSTPSPDSRDDLRDDPTDRHGDVDRNGDLVDHLQREIAADRARQEERLRAAIVADSPSLADDQLRAVRQMVRGWTVPGIGATS